MNKNTDLHTKLTPEQMEEALKIINEAWVSMNGEEFGRLCLDKDPHGPSQSWVNENFRRFQNDLGGQINKTSGDYMPKLAAGLVEFYNQHREPQPYHVLLVDYGNGWEYEFGAYDRVDVVAEKMHVEDNVENENEIKTKVVRTVSNRPVKDLLDEINGNAKPAEHGQLTGSAKPATEEKPKSKIEKNEKNVGFGDRDAFRKAAIKVVEEAAKTRKKSGALISEADLVTGAAAIMQLVDVNYFGADPEGFEIMPPAWFFAIIRGESINGGSLPANTVLIETWTESIDGYEREKCARITAPHFIDVEERDLDEIKEEYTGEERALMLADIHDLRNAIRS